MPRANLTPILWHLGESQCTRISTVLCCLKKTVANTTSQLYVANRLQCRSITYDMSIGLMSHSSICSCLTHKAVRHQPRSLLIGCHPGRGSAAPQPISRAERHTRIARRFGAQRHTAFQQRTLSTSRFLLVRGLQPCALHSEGDWRKFFCQDVVTKPYQWSFDDLYEGA